MLCGVAAAVGSYQMIFLFVCDLKHIRSEEASPSDRPKVFIRWKPFANIDLRKYLNIDDSIDVIHYVNLRV